MPVSIPPASTPVEDIRRLSSAHHVYTTELILVEKEEQLDVNSSCARKASSAWCVDGGDIGQRVCAHLE